MNTYHTYAPPPPASTHNYGTNGYTSGYYGGQILSPPSASLSSSHGSQLMPVSNLPPTTQAAYSSQPTPPYAQSQHQPVPDTTGQIAPSGHKPKVTATLWEDEGTICFQVECDGLCVARREDNQFINGTKLLNVAGMTRGRRDGILKSEKTRSVVKIGPMHLKGVWIPFDRALDFANREKITEKLYPLFVHNISQLLPNTGMHRGAGGLQTRGKVGMGGHTAPITHPPLTQHHSSMQLPSQVPGSQRPPIDRAQTFPTPPTSASSVMNHGSEYWSSSSLNGSIQGSQPTMGLDNAINSTRSMPSTPASTPPGTSLQSISGFHPQGLSSAAQSTSHYTPHYSSANSYLKNDMGPPSRSSTLPGTDSKDGKSDPFTSSQSSHDAAGSDHGSSYSQETNGLGGNHNSFHYQSMPSVHMLSNHSDGSDPVGSSTHHDAATGQITPRTSISHEPWAGYQTPPRTNTYPSANYPSALVNGSNKRSRDDEDNDFKLTGDLDSMKRHKTGRDDILNSRPGIMQHAVR